MNASISPRKAVGSWLARTRAASVGPCAAGWVCDLLYTGLCRGIPAGLAMEEARLFTPVGTLLMQHARAVGGFATARPAARRPALDRALYSKVAAYDRAGTVLLGDPTVAVAVPPEVRARATDR